ncbi:MAG: hypothetical protein HGA75_04625 [Thiobacillus sp.]|nr:hypothetical protein [Thiobacillus sp.]
MVESFVVEWPVIGETMKPEDALVAVRMSGRRAGLYRVKQVMREGLLLSHGAISFPVGTQLDIEQVHDAIPGVSQSARVVANDQSGVSLAWS